MNIEDETSIRIGTIARGRYEIVKCLAAGSTAAVFSCRDRELFDRLVAMKVLHPTLLGDATEFACFQNQIITCRRVDHPQVIRIYESFLTNALAAFTMEYAAGGSLLDRIDDAKQIAIEEVMRILSQLCSSVQAIHKAGIIHRDLRPENVLFTEDGNVRITGFGIAHTKDEPTAAQRAAVLGAVDYVSPEYLEHGQLDARADLYALGMIAYSMLSGSIPYDEGDVLRSLAGRLRSDPPVPSTLRRDCPEQLDGIVLKAMAREPENRYQTALEMYLDLELLSASLFSSRAKVPSGSLTFIAEEAVEDHALNGSSGKRAIDTKKATMKLPAGVKPKISWPHILAPAQNAAERMVKRVRGTVPWLRILAFTQHTTERIARKIRDVTPWQRLQQLSLSAMAVIGCLAVICFRYVVLGLKVAGRVDRKARASLPAPFFHFFGLCMIGVAGFLVGLVVLPGSDFSRTGVDLNAKAIAQQPTARALLQEPVEESELNSSATKTSSSQATPLTDYRLETLLSSKEANAVILRDAIEAAGRNRSRRLTALLAKLSQHNNPVICIYALKALSQPPHSKRLAGLDAMLESLSHRDFLVRGFSAKLIGDLNDPTLLAALESQLDVEESAIVRQKLEHAIERLEG